MNVAPTVSESPKTLAVVMALSLTVFAAVAATLYWVPATPSNVGPTPLATMNACLNGLAGIGLVLGYVYVRQGKLRAHRMAMLFAFGASSLFLVTYLLHHAQVGSVPFQQQGFIRKVYFALLVPHIVLAAAVVPLALLTIYRGWTNRVERHRAIARITLPIWLFVSLSGVLVYWMLYHL